MSFGYWKCHINTKYQVLLLLVLLLVKMYVHSTLNVDSAQYLFSVDLQEYQSIQSFLVSDLPHKQKCWDSLANALFLFRAYCSLYYQVLIRKEVWIRWLLDYFQFMVLFHNISTRYFLWLVGACGMEIFEVASVKN